MSSRKGDRTRQQSPPENEEEGESDEESERESSGDEEEVPAEKIPKVAILKNLERKKETVPKKKRVEFVTPEAGPSIVKGKEKEAGSSKPPLLPYVEVPRLKDLYKERSAAPKSHIPAVEKQQPAYKRQAPIQKTPLDMSEILKRLDDTKVEITQGELMRMASAMRKDYVKHLTPKRVATQQFGLANVVPGEEEMESLVETEAPELSAVEATMEEGEVEEMGPRGQEIDVEELEYVDIRTLPMAGMYVLQEATNELPAGAIVLEDPVEQFFNTMDQRQVPRRVIAASESQALKALHPIINGVSTQESLIDGGSQIVSMSLSTATALKLSWDPRIVIHMQSANKQVVPTEGLARNVPFRFDDITVYLQVHILRNVAYKVLLGRPWEVLTSCNIKNHPDGSQVVTLTDPNTGQVCAMPSYDRGQLPILLEKNAPLKKDFQ